MAPGTVSLQTHGRRAASQSLWLEALGNLRRNPSAIAGMLVIGTLILIALAAPLVATHDPILSMIGQPGETGRLQAKAPCTLLPGCEDPAHYMGLDLNARDLYSRVIFGTRTSLSVGIITLSLSIVTGTRPGLVPGFNLPGDGMRDALDPRLNRNQHPGSSRGGQYPVQDVRARRVARSAAASASALLR